MRCSAFVKNAEWSDLSFNFLVAPDGVVYVGRGWDSVGATALGCDTLHLWGSLKGGP